MATNPSMVGLKNKRAHQHNNGSHAKKKKDSGAAGFKGPVKIELLKGAGLL